MVYALCLIADLFYRIVSFQLRTNNYFISYGIKMTSNNARAM